MSKQDQHPRIQLALRDSGRAPGLELRHLRALVTLVDQGSMTSAARVLRVAQSTISEALAALERALGTRVVTRSRGGHSVALTPAGAALLPYARAMLASLEDAQVAVAAVARDVRTSVEIIANESISTYLLPRVLGMLRERWPNTRFAVTVGMCPSITEGVATGRYDLGLLLQTAQCATASRSDQVDPTGRVPLTEVPLVVFSRPEHPLVAAAEGTQVPRDRLEPYTVFVSDAKGYFYDLLRDFFHADGTLRPRLEPTGSVEAVKRSVTANPMALGVLPAYALDEEFRTGRLCAISLKPGLPSVLLEAKAYRTRPPAHPAVTELIEVLRTTLSGRPERQLATV
jgi:DNA-binding transcriptional LysR family regulator